MDKVESVQIDQSILGRMLGYGTVTILGTGEEMRDYLYAGDVGRALVTLANKSPFQGEAVNVASGAGTTIATLAEKIFAALGIGDRPRFTGSIAPGNPLRWIAEVDSLHRLGFIALLDGLAIGPASVLIPVAQLGFVFTAVLGRLLFAETLSWRKRCGLVVAAAAMVTLAFS